MISRHDIAEQQHRHAREFKPETVDILVYDNDTYLQHIIKNFEYEWREHCGKTEVSCAFPVLPEKVQGDLFIVERESVELDIKCFIADDRKVSVNDIVIFWLNNA